MIRLDRVKKHYEHFDLDCSLRVLPGCVTGLIGKNGAGKSTMFRLLLGLSRRDSGTIEVFGRPVETLGVKEKADIGVVLADSGFSGYLTVWDLISILDQMYPEFRREEFRGRCMEYGLPLKKKIKEFSTGMKQKLQVLAAISHGAKLLVFDEPTSGLDVVARDELLGLLREYMETQERSILISSHISADLEGFCDDVYMIDDGKIVLHEETDVLLDEYALLKVTPQQYGRLDKTAILRQKRESFGYSCLTSQKRFYQENYPDVAIEKGSIDEVITMMIKGEAI